MNQDDYKKILAEALNPLRTDFKEIKDKLENVERQLNDPKTGMARINYKLDTLWDQVIRLTEDFEGIKNNVDNIYKADKRLSEAESRLGIIPPPELTVIR